MRTTTYTHSLLADTEKAKCVQEKQKHIDEHINAILADSCISVADLSLTIIIGEGQIPSCSVFSCHHMSRDGWMDGCLYYL